MKEPQKTTNTKRPVKRKKKKRRSSLLLLYIALGFGAVVTLTVLSLTVFFHINTVEVTGKSRYTKDQILLAANIPTDVNLFLAKTDHASSAVRTSLPYIDSVEVSKNFPSTVVIKVSESPAYAQIEQDGHFVLINKGGKVLERTNKLQKNIPVIRGADIKPETPGKAVEYTDADKQKALESVFSAFEEKKISPITVVSAKSAVDVSVTYNNKIVLELGSTANLDKKLSYAKTIIDEQASGRQTGVLNLSYIPNDKGQVYFVKGALSDQQTADVLKK